MALQGFNPWTLTGLSFVRTHGFVLLGAKRVHLSEILFIKDFSMKRQFKFTKKLLDALPPCPADSKSKTEIEFSDVDVCGLRVVCNRLGRKYFMLRYTFDARKRCMKLGDYPAMDIGMARERAQELRSMIAKGVDPQVVVVIPEPVRCQTLSEFFDADFLPYSKVANRSWKDSLGRWRHHLQPAFGSQLLTELKTQDIQRFHDSKRIQLCAATANRLLSLLKRALNLACLWGKLDKNPVKGIRMHVENNQRLRYLMGDELRRFLSALDDEPNRTAALYFRFLLATGTRRSESLTLRWADLDMAGARWLLPTSKNGRSRFVQLNSVALQVLDAQRAVARNEWVFPACGNRPGHLGDPKKAFARILKAAKIDSDIVIHSLRHSYASYLVQGGSGGGHQPLTEVQNLQVVQSLLGHRQMSTTAIYAHLSQNQLASAAENVAMVLQAAHA